MLNEKKIYHESFEEQFSQKKEIEVLGGKIEVVDLSPENPKTEVPVLFAPGWSETPEALKDSLRAIYERGRRVLSLAHARKGGDEKFAPEKAQKEYPADELRKAMALLKLLDEKNIGKIDVVAHSEGGVNTAIAASLQPEKFRNLILINPAGLIGKDKFPKLAGRFLLSAIQDAGKISPWGGIKYVSQNPARALKEAVAISKSETENMLKDLHNLGIGIGVISGVDDPVFPMERTQVILTKSKIDAFLSVKGGHNEIIINPEKYAAAADDLLDKLEKKNS